MSTLDINHTLFDQQGSPLRVKISVTFLKYVAPEKRAKDERNESPDLTHYRILKQGERLDMLSFQQYSTPNYLLQVARFNTLTTIRGNKAGQEIYLPPLDKSEK